MRSSVSLERSNSFTGPNANGKTGNRRSTGISTILEEGGLKVPQTFKKQQRSSKSFSKSFVREQDIDDGYNNPSLATQVQQSSHQQQQQQNSELDQSNNMVREKSLFTHQAPVMTLASKLQNKLVKGSLRHYELVMMQKQRNKSNNPDDTIIDAPSVLSTESPTITSPSVMGGNSTGGGPSSMANYRVALSDRILLTKKDDKAPITRRQMERDDAKVQLFFRHLTSSVAFKQHSHSLSPLSQLEYVQSKRQEEMQKYLESAAINSKEFGNREFEIALENAVFESIANLVGATPLPAATGQSTEPVTNTVAGGRVSLPPIPHKGSITAAGTPTKQLSSRSNSTDDIMQKEMEIMAEAKRQGTRFERMFQEIFKKLEQGRKGLGGNDRSDSQTPDDKLNEKLMNFKIDEATKYQQQQQQQVPPGESNGGENQGNNAATIEAGNPTTSTTQQAFRGKIEAKNIIEELFAYHSDFPDIAATYRNAFLARQSKLSGPGGAMGNNGKGLPIDWLESRHRIKAATEVSNWITFLRSNEIAKSAFLSAMKDVMRNMERARIQSLQTGIQMMGRDFIKENSEPGHYDRMFLPQVKKQRIRAQAQEREERFAKVLRSRRLVEIDREERLLNQLAKHDDAIRQQMLIKGQEETALKRKRLMWAMLIIIQQKFSIMIQGIRERHKMMEDREQLVNATILAQRLWRRVLRTRLKRQIEETVREVGHKLKPMLMGWQGRRFRRAGNILVEHMRESQAYVVLNRAAKSFKFNIGICGKQIRCYLTTMKSQSLLVHEQWMRWSYARATKEMMKTAGLANSGLLLKQPVARNKGSSSIPSTFPMLALETDPKTIERVSKIREFLLHRLRKHMKHLTENGVYSFSLAKPPPTKDVQVILEREDPYKYRQKVILSLEELEELDKFLIASQVNKNSHK